jgi:hypothetical protein
MEQYVRADTRPGTEGQSQDNIVGFQDLSIGLKGSDVLTLGCIPFILKCIFDIFMKCQKNQNKKLCVYLHVIRVHKVIP